MINIIQMKVNLVFDYSNMAFRSLFIIGKVGLRDNYASQKDVNRYITKLATDISYIVRTYVPESRVIMAMDAKGPWRKELLKNEPIGYKGTREKDETIEWGNIFEALDEFAEILEKNNMSVMKIPHAEGDDLIAMYKEHFLENTKDESIIIVSADKDIRQLVDFKPDTKQFSMVLNPVNTYKKKTKKLYLTQELLDYYKSPVTNDVECRQGFFVESSEASLWAEGVTKFYKDKEIPYLLYLNGQLQDSYGTLFGE